VIDINYSALPSRGEVATWASDRFSNALRHNKDNSEYNPNMRQLIHVAYKIAASQIADYYRLLETNEEVISGCVYENLYDRHICKLFGLE
jgi:hypothetical protein